VFRTILTFITVPLVTLVLGAIVLTVGVALPGRWCFNPVFRLWSACILAAAGVRLHVEGAEQIDHRREHFFVGNHQSLFDIPIIAAVTRGRVRFLAKRSLFRIPVFGWILLAHDFVSIDRSSARKTVASLAEMAKRLKKRPVSLLVFPEGTRTRDGTITPFKRGAIQVCKRTGLPVVPIAVDGSMRIHLRDTKRIRAGDVRVRLGEPIPVDEVAETSADELTARLENEIHDMLGRPTGLNDEYSMTNDERMSNHP